MEVTAGGETILCLLDTGSQVTLFSETFFKRHFQNHQAKSKTDICWLKLKAANGLRIPYVGYVMLDFKIGGVEVPQRGVLIVSDCMGPDHGLLGMNVIESVWETVNGGRHPGLQVFRSAVPASLHQEWDRVFACCQRALAVVPTEDQLVTARLTRQQPVVVPPETEMVLWAQVPGDSGKASYTALVEGMDAETEWQVAHSLVEVVNNKIPDCVTLTHIPLRSHNVNHWQKCVTFHLIKFMVMSLCCRNRQTEVEVAVRAVQELAEDSTAGGLPRCPHLPQQQQDRVNALLAKWKCVFAQDEEDFGETSAVLHQIPTGNAPPTRERYRTVPPSLKNCGHSYRLC